MRTYIEESAQLLFFLTPQFFLLLFKSFAVQSKIEMKNRQEMFSLKMLSILITAFWDSRLLWRYPEKLNVYVQQEGACICHNNNQHSPQHTHKQVSQPKNPVWISQPLIQRSFKEFVGKGCGSASQSALLHCGASTEQERNRQRRCEVTKLLAVRQYTESTAMSVNDKFRKDSDTVICPSFCSVVLKRATDMQQLFAK